MIQDKKWISLEIGKLVAAPWNYKEDDSDKATKLKNNISRNGQVENIIVRELESGNFEVVNGNHRLTAFAELGLKKVVAFNLGKISDRQAQRIAIETNETRFETKTQELAQLLKDIVEDGFSVDDLALTMPFEVPEIESMIKLLDFDWDSYDKQNVKEHQDDSTTNSEPRFFICPKCGHEFGDV